MAAGGKPDRGQFAHAIRAGADQAHGALGVLQRHAGAVLPAFARQAVTQHKTSDAQAGEMLGDLAPAAVAAFASITAARNDQQAQAIGPRSAIYEKAGRLDLADGADMETVRLDRIGDFQIEGDAFAARRRAGPERHEFLGIAGQSARFDLGVSRA
jgi:hypothetical protein